MIRYEMGAYKYREKGENNMIKIGICDDCKEDNVWIQQCCEKFFREYKVECEYEIFYSGEEVLEYCKEKKNKEDRIDILFLDIEMVGISGIDLKDKIIKEKNIWRIVFVSSHLEAMQLAFGLKTMGFIMKPAKIEEIHRWLKIVAEDKQEEVLVEIPKCTVMNEKYVWLEDIAYVKANGNYSEIYRYDKKDAPTLVICKLKELEKAWINLPIIRIHKSYMINLMNVIDISGKVVLRDIEERIAIGRRYSDLVDKKYHEYSKQMMRRRM